MFYSGGSSITNATPIFQAPSSFFGYQMDDIFVPTHDHFFPNVAMADSPVLDNCTHHHILDQNYKNHLYCDPFMINLLPPKWKKPDVLVKTHRNRKIVTAQGPRDRRVRMSIQIARQFFDLQDTLGFDKASKTLAWLLKKSQSAIDEIKERRCTTGLNEQEKINQVAEIGDNFQKNSSVSSSGTCSGAKERGVSMHQQNCKYLLAKELRAKARERARERTKVKMSLRKLNEAKKLGSEFCPIFPYSWNQFSTPEMMPYDNRPSEMSRSIENLIQIERKLKPLQNFTTYQQSFTSSKQQQQLYSSNINENWERSSQKCPSTAGLQHMEGYRARCRSKFMRPYHLSPNQSRVGRKTRGCVS